MTMLAQLRRAAAAALPFAVPTLLVGTYGVGITRIHGRSMSPALNPTATTPKDHSDVVLVDLLTPAWRPHMLSRGDVVLLTLPSDPDVTIIKRIRYLPGDTVGSALIARGFPGTRHWSFGTDDPEEDGAGWHFGVASSNLAGRGDLLGGGASADATAADDDEYAMAIKVPEGRIWVEGDEEMHGVDSRQFGPVPIGLVTGRALAIVWPPSRIGRIISKS